MTRMVGGGSVTSINFYQTPGEEEGTWDVHARVSIRPKTGESKAAKAIGYRVSWRVVRDMLGRPIQRVYHGERIVASPEEAADVCLRTLESVRKVPPNYWLWITDLEYDDWPDPLPRPQTWPPQ